jgi:hypothetical protein
MAIGPAHRQVALSTSVPCRYRLVSPCQLGRTLPGVATFSIRFRATELPLINLLKCLYLFRIFSGYKVRIKLDLLLADHLRPTPIQVIHRRVISTFRDGVCSDYGLSLHIATNESHVNQTE